MIDVLDESGNRTGQVVTRDEVEGAEIISRVTVGFVINKAGQVLVSRRALTRTRFPGYWDKSVGGHVSIDETVQSAIIREASEELGMSLTPLDVFFVGDYKGALTYKGVTNRWIVNVFLIKTDMDIADFKIQESEVAEIKYVDKSWVDAHTDKTDPDNSILGDAAWGLAKNWMENK